MKWDIYLNFLVAMLAIVNPIGLVPMWSEMTGDVSYKIRKRLAVILIGFSIICLILFTIGGKYILQFFSIDLTVFKVAGGILLLTSGIKMVEGTNTNLQNADEGDGTPLQLAKARFRKILVPLGIPAIVGPGSITTVMLFGSSMDSIIGYLILSIVVALALSSLFIMLISSGYIEKKVDPLAFIAITRLFGIIVTAIALQFILEGLGDVFPNWIDHSSPVEESSTKKPETGQ